MTTRLYLDHNATTPLDPAVRAAMEPYLGQGGNPSSIHAEGRRARAAVDDARDRVAALLGAKPGEIVFTSGGTESCNLAIRGLALASAGARAATSSPPPRSITPSWTAATRWKKRAGPSPSCPSARRGGSTWPRWKPPCGRTPRWPPS